MKVWVTIRALTFGIEEMEGERCADFAHMVWVQRADGYRKYLFKDQWHSTPAAALAKAEQMRAAKIASLRKSLARLEALTFAP